MDDVRSHYAELHRHSNLFFLEGAPHVEELVPAREPAYQALALTDDDALHGATEVALVWEIGKSLLSLPPRLPDWSSGR